MQALTVALCRLGLVIARNARLICRAGKQTWESDCRPTSGRQVEGHYEVKVNGAWVSVPAGKILK